MKTKHQCISLFLIVIMITYPLAQTYATCPGPPCPPPDCSAEHDAVAAARSAVQVAQEAVRSQREDVTACVSTPETDGCNNSIKVQCGPDPYCLYRYVYNDSTTMSDCIWHNGANAWEYRKTSDGKRFHSARHATVHQCNSHASCPYDSGCDGYYCWRIIDHNCISNQITSTDWRRDTTMPGSETVWTAGSSHTCPGP